MVTRPGRSAPLPLLLGFAVFVVVLAYLVAASVARRRGMPEFSPSPTSPSIAAPESLVLDTVTIDARDQTAWRFFDFSTARVMQSPDTAGWDLAVRRFNVIAAGAAIDLGPVTFDTVVSAPPDGYVASEFGPDTANAALERWYRYGFLSHLLRPKGHVYVVHTADRRYAKLEFLSYYCSGGVPGCLTFRYAYQPNGERLLR
jgi:hypothetical protein